MKFLQAGPDGDITGAEGCLRDVTQQQAWEAGGRRSPSGFTVVSSPGTDVSGKMEDFPGKI